MSLASLIDENGPGGIDLARWTGSLCLVLLFHASVSLAFLNTTEPPDSPAERESIIMIELPVESILPQAESVASVAADAAEEVETAEMVETNELPPQEIVEETVEEVTEETPVEQVVETQMEVVEEVKPTEISETALVVAEIVPPTETVKAEPVETPEPVKPKAKPKPKPKPQKASTASVNSKAAAGAGRSNPKVLSRYLSQVRASIMRHRRSVSGARGTVVIAVTIGKSGGLSGIRVARSSGSGPLDRAALGIVRSVGRVGAIPAETGRSSLSLNVPFKF